MTDLARRLVDVLDPFEEATTIASSKEYPTVTVVHPLVKHLIASVTVTVESTPEFTTPDDVDVDKYDIGVKTTADTDEAYHSYVHGHDAGGCSATYSRVHVLKATSSLFARMLVIAWSSREDIDLETVIGTYEFAYTNRMLLQPDGCTYPTTVIHMLENLVNTDGNATPELCKDEPSCLTVDRMAVLHELMAVKNFKDCKNLAVSYVKLTDLKARGYDQVRVIFDNYTKVPSLKEGTRQPCRGEIKGTRLYIVGSSTHIRDKRTFLTSNNTKDSHTLYLAEQLMGTSISAKLMTTAHQSVTTNIECLTTTGVRTQEEADTMMILHAAEVASSGFVVHNAHIFTRHTCAPLGSLQGARTWQQSSSGECRHKVMLKPISEKLGPEKCAALINWHSLTGCDTTGHIQQKGK